MSGEYTPTVDEVRGVYVASGFRENLPHSHQSLDEWRAEFDRWLKGRSEVQMRFWTKVERVVGGCWIWTANTATNGYGRVKIDGISRPAHRVAYEWLVGPVPGGMELDHVRARGCTSRACVNPSHLEPVTHRENTLRGDTITSQQAGRTHCPRGHELVEGNLVPSSLKQGRRGCLTCSREKAAERRSHG